MLNPTKKGTLTYNNVVSVRGFENINIFAAMCVIMYGPEHESKFNTKDFKKAITERNNLYMQKVSPVVSQYDALYEVYTNYLEQSEKARAEFDALEDLECTEEVLTEVFKAIRNAKSNPVESLEEAVSESELVEEVIPAIVETDTSEDAIKEELSPEEESTDESLDMGVVEYDEKESNTVYQSEETIEEEPEEIPVEQTEEYWNNSEVTSDVAMPSEGEKATNSTDETLLETVQKARAELEAAEPIEESQYASAIYGKFKVEVDNFKLMPNDVNARAILDKLMSIVPGVSIVDLVYNNEINKAMFIEFGGAASMLSSFRILALGLMSNGR